VAIWAAELGMAAIHGPLGFTDLDHQGMLVEGFDELDLFITNYNAPYYVAHMEALGFIKDVDWVECQLKLDECKAYRLSQIADHVAKRSSFKLIEFRSKKEILPWAKPVFELYNRAYAPLYGMTELAENQIDAYIKSFFGFVNPDFIKVVVDSSNQLAGFSIAMPSLSKAMQRSKGKLFPLGFLPILKAIKQNDVLDLYLIAISPEHQNSGINALMLSSVMSTAKRYGMTHAESGPMLETNQKVQAQWKFFDVRQHRRRRVYIKKI
jgi:GNAT superfamily N-acetyltransferase